MDLKRIVRSAALGAGPMLIAPAGCYTGHNGTGEPNGGMADGAGSGTADGGSADGEEPIPEQDELGAPSTAARRLSRREVDTVILEIFGLAGVGTTYLPLDTLAPFDTDAAGKLPSAVFVDGHEALAEHVASTVVADTAAVEALAGCVPTVNADADCLRQLAQRLGRRLWRRPLADDELDRMLSEALSLATDEGGFSVGAQFVIQSLLLSPEFIYLTQVGVEEDGYRRLTPHELAARVAFLLLGTAPDEAMLDRADQGPWTDEDLAAAVETMLAARAEQVGEQVVSFHSQWFGVQAPRLPEQYQADATLMTDTFLRELLNEQPEPWTQLFLSDRTYVTAELAQFVGLPSPAGGEGWVDYPDPTQQSGMLSHPSWLSLSALIEDETSVTKRGLRITRDLLCRTIPPPPPNVNVDNIEVPETGCLSDVYAAHTVPGTGCFACHAAFDPVGAGLERWDAYGRYRETEPNRPECSVDGQGDLAEHGTFSGPRQLAELMIDSGELTRCLAQRLVQFDTGRPAGPGDRPALERIVEKFSDSNESIRALVSAYVADPVFRYRMDEEVCK